LVIGGGAVAERRVKVLLSAGAAVTIVAPELSEALQERVRDGTVVHIAGRFDSQDLEPYWLIVAATNDHDLNARVAAAAEQAHRFCNVVDDPEHCSFIMPAIVDREPVTIAVSSSGRSPVLARWIKGVIETALPARVGALAELAGRWRTRVKKALPAMDTRRQFWQSALQGAAAQQCYAGRDKDAETAFAQELESWRSDERPPQARGEAYLVGAGPGAPDLITVRGRQLLAEADVVLYDRLANPKLLDYARRDAELICVAKTPRKPSITQAQLNRLLVRLVASGQRVCRLKGGDPLVFGRGGEEMEALTEAGLHFQIVPGISAVQGCAAYAGIPLTLRGEAKAVLIATGYTRDGDNSHLEACRPGQTLALYMSVAQFEAIGDLLMKNGHAPETPAAIVENGTTEHQRVILTTLSRLAQIKDEWQIVSPALLLVGETVKYAERYSWFHPAGVQTIKDKNTPSLARVS
jgi:uroporphyrin-III C-methyltransferase/precorrin-2 dehydrogenase/sirohydrochlorin ferrochelatase